MSVLAIVPARAGSRGIPHKNFTPLAGWSPLHRAISVVHQAVRAEPVVSSDLMPEHAGVYTERGERVTVSRAVHWLQRPSELAQDDTPMIDVVQHVLAEIPGPEDQIILLVQPTQPLREPKHLHAAVALLRETQADSVVSVVELPKTHSPDCVCQVVRFPTGEERLRPWPYDSGDGESMRPWSARPARRQDATSAYIPDGTVYAFYRRNVRYGHIFGGGDRVRPLIIPPEETCSLDTPADWAEAERRLRDREVAMSETQRRVP